MQLEAAMIATLARPMSQVTTLSMVETGKSTAIITSPEECRLEVLLYPETLHRMLRENPPV